MAPERVFGRVYMSSDEDEPGPDDTLAALMELDQEDDCLEDLAALLSAPPDNTKQKQKPLLKKGSSNSQPKANGQDTSPRTTKLESSSLSGEGCTACGAKRVSGNFCNLCGAPLRKRTAPAKVNPALKRTLSQTLAPSASGITLDLSSSSLSEVPTKRRRTGAGSRDPPLRVSSSSGDEVGFVEPHSKIRISHPVVSSEDLSRRLSGVKIVPLNQLNRVGNTVHGAWVLFGVVHSKFPPSDSKSGKKYLRFSITDMQGTLITVFAFGRAFEDCWRLEPGTLVCIAQPEITNRATDNGSVGISLKLFQGGELQEVGRAVHFGFCKSLTRAGVRCRNSVDTSKGQHCEYHVKQEYKRTMASRMNLNRTPTFNSGVRVSGQAPQQRNLSAAAPTRSLLSPGLKAHSSMVASLPSRSTVPTPSLKAVASQSKFMQRIADHRAKLKTPSQQPKPQLDRPGISRLDMLLQLQAQESSSRTVSEEESLETEQLRLARELAAQPELQQQEEERRKRALAKQLLQQEKARERAAAAAATPERFKTTEKPRSSRASKTQLWQPTVSPGPRTAAMKKDRSSPISTQDLLKSIQKRARAKKSSSNVTSLPGAPPKMQKSKASLSSQMATLFPEMHRSLQSAEGRRAVMSKDSAHAEDLKRAKREALEQEMTWAEKVESLQAQMEGTKEQKVPAWYCRQCRVLSEVYPKTCRSQMHSVEKKEAVKRWFRCQSCNARDWTLDRLLPVGACRKCGAKNFARSSLMERKAVGRLSDIRIKNGKTREELASCWREKLQPRLVE